MLRARIPILVVMLCAAVCNAANLPINLESVGKSIVFLFNEHNEPVGTGFIIAVPFKGDTGQGVLAVVTARHVVDPEWAGCPAANPTVLAARVNKKDFVPGVGESGTDSVPLVLVQNGRRLFLTHPADNRVDAVVIPIAEPGRFKANDVSWVQLYDFSSKGEIDKFGIGVGDQFVSAGLVPTYAGQPRNYPAFKFGRVSNVFDQPIETSRCVPTSRSIPKWAWLLAGNFVGGNSGSPIFLLPVDFTVAAPLQYNGPRVMLLGLLSSSLTGADLAEMTPAEYIFEIIKANYPNADLYRGDPKQKPANIK